MHMLGFSMDTRSCELSVEVAVFTRFLREGGPPEVDTGCCSHRKVWTLFQRAMYLACMRQTTMAAGRIFPFST